MTASTRPVADDLARRLTTSDLDKNQILELQAIVEDLCSEYSTGDPAALKSRSEATLAQIDELLASRLTLSDHRLLLEQAGWLVLLIAALAYDLGEPAAAEKARTVALGIGHDLQSSSILGWAHETDVWMQIANSNWTVAIEKATEGLAIAGDAEPTGVAIQLALQQAEAEARLGNAEGMTDALETARQLLATHEPPRNPRNHFAFDLAKFDLREMRTLLVVGHDEQAEQIAIRLQREFDKPDGTSKYPMRSSEILASRALIEARRGNIGQAIDLAHQAIDIGRRSRLSFHQITSAIANELTKHDHLESVQAFLDQRASLLDVSDDR